MSDSVLNQKKQLFDIDPEDDFDSVLIEIKKMHDSKREDYSDKFDRFSNFREAAEAANIPVTAAFEVLIGVKQARLKQLTKPDRTKSPNNEPIIDTLLDRAVYAILAYAYYKKIS